MRKTPSKSRSGDGRRPIGSRPGRHRLGRSRLALLAVVVVPLLAITGGEGLLSLFPASTAAAAAGDCKDFYVISAMGSGETFGKNPQDLSGTPETASVDEGIRRSFAAAGKTPNYEIDNINYPALPVDGMQQALKAVITSRINPIAVLLAQGAISRYLAGERSGEEKTNFEINRIAKQCDAARKVPKFVLAGYSQGAMVMHNVLASSSQRANIVGSALIADPERLPESGLKNFSTASETNKNSYGLCAQLLRLPTYIKGRPSCIPNYGAIPLLPAQNSQDTYEVCASNDIVCDTSTDFSIADPFGSLERLQSGSWEHVKCHVYCTSTTRLAGEAIARKLLSTVSTSGGGGSSGSGGTTTASAPALSPTKLQDGELLTISSSSPCGLPAGASPEGQVEADAWMRPLGGLKDSEGGEERPLDGHLVVAGEPFTINTLVPVNQESVGADGRPDGGDGDPVIGNYVVSVRCTYTPRGGGAMNTFLVMPDAPFAVTGPGTPLDIPTSTITSGQSVTVSGQRPCPTGSDKVTVDWIAYRDPIGYGPQAVNGVPDVEGKWSTQMTPPGPGQWSFSAFCYRQNQPTLRYRDTPRIVTVVSPS